MAKSKVDLILNPVRLRILMALQGRKLTPGLLAEQLPDVAQATLYRHIATLEKAGLIAVAETRQVRGATERLLELKDAKELDIDRDELTGASPEDHLRYFTSFVLSLLNNFENYLRVEQKPQDIVKKIGYHTRQVYLDPMKLNDFGRRLHELLELYSRPSPDTTDESFLFSTVLMPELFTEEDKK